MTQIFNQKPHTLLRKNLRNLTPKPELVVWGYIRRKQLNGYKFRRQFGIGRYVVDFYCPKARFAIEIDGDSHYTEEAIVYDTERGQYISELGIRLIRFTNDDVMNNKEGVIAEIQKYLPVA